MATGHHNASDPLNEPPLFFRRKRNINPHARAPSNGQLKNVESSTASQATGTPGKLRRKASTKDGDASIAYTLRPSKTRTSVMGNPAPQPKSMTVAPLGRVRAHSRTALT